MVTLLSEAGAAPPASLLHALRADAADTAALSL